MQILIFGGAGFVGLNIASAFLEAGHRVTLFDQAPPPAAFGTRAAFVQGDVRDAEAIEVAFAEAVDVVVLGAAVTAGPARETSDPHTILAVNLGAIPTLLASCRRHGVRRVINLSSAAAYGSAPAIDGLLLEATPAEPESLYAITKFASERVARRLAALWELDVLNLRLSAVFGRWERPTGVRDTLSPQAQMLAAATAGRPALLARPGERDWIYASDVGQAVCLLAEIKTPRSLLYNVTTDRRWSALAWGKALARHMRDFECRLVEPGEAPTIDLHSPMDRPSLSPDLLRRDVGWQARFDIEDSACDLALWWGQKSGS